MAIRRSILSLPLAVMISSFAGCGGGSTANVQNPPPPQSLPVTIEFQPVPATSVALNATASLTAVVGNDPSNTGVDWSLTCSVAGTVPNKCGSLSALHTASSAATIYTPPATITGNGVPVTIVAFATADHTQNVTAPITVTGFGSTLRGTYVLQAQGIDSATFEPYQFAAAVVFDGNGGITSGEQTANFYDSNIGFLTSKSDTVAGGSYFVGPDGRGTILINTSDPDVGLNGTESFSFIALSNSQALIAQTDFAVTASGTMDLQSSTTTPSGGYAFVVSGTDIATASPTAMGGVFNIDSPNTISGTGSVADQNLAGTLTIKQGLSGTISNPDSFGAVTLNLNVPGFPTSTTFQFLGYVVDATHIKLIENDNIDGGGSGTTGGIAIGQGSATGTFLDDTSFSGTYIFGVLGQDLNTSFPSTLTSVGKFTADGAGTIANGYTDTFFQANGLQGTAGAQIRAAFGGTYTTDTKGTGRIRVNLNHFVPAPQPAIVPVLFFYLTGNGNPPLVLDAGDFSPALNYPSLGTGIAYLRKTSTPPFGGSYGFSITQENGAGENDGTGRFDASASAGTVSGSLDMNTSFNSQLDNSVTGTFPPGSTGRFAGKLDSPVFYATPFTVEYYAIDSGHGFFVETDLANPNNPTDVVSFGYYAVRQPICTGCP